MLIKDISICQSSERRKARGSVAGKFSGPSLKDRYIFVLSILTIERNVKSQRFPPKTKFLRAQSNSTRLFLFEKRYIITYCAGQTESKTVGRILLFLGAG